MKKSILFKIELLTNIEINKFSDENPIVEINPFTDDLLIRHEIDTICKYKQHV
jgi:hypothetical protein